MKDNNPKRKILKDRKFPDSDQIKKHQDFDRINQDYSLIKKVMMKKIFIWSSAAICIAGIGTLVLLNMKPEKNSEPLVEKKTETKSDACIRVPIPGKETPYAVYRVSSKNGGVIHYATGSSVTIPANAFVNKDGSPVSDSVDVKYREFHNPLDIFLSGIPMNYDSAGTKYTLESAGMLEILAFDKGKILSLNEQTPLQIRMASSSDEERFNLYELDTLNKNWVYKGKDKIEKLQEKKIPQTKKQIKETTKVVVDNSIKPEMSDPRSYTFTIGYEKSEFPELSAYDNVIFEVKDNNFKPSYYKIDWDLISVYNGDAPGLYIIKLKKADTTISIKAKPVFDKTAYSEALQKFEEKHKQSSTERDQKEFEKQAAVNEVNKGLTGYNTNQIIGAATSMIRLSSFRTFPVRTLGFHNIDMPIPPILAYAYSIKSLSESRKNLSNNQGGGYNTIFLAEKGVNTVFRFSKGESVRCNPNKENLMWTLTDRNEIAFFRIADYKKLSNGAENNIDPVVAKNQDLAFEEIRKFSE